jgi:putative nucleotidyltransferase with HDIG domain
MQFLLFDGGRRPREPITPVRRIQDVHEGAAEHCVTAALRLWAGTVAAASLLLAGSLTLVGTRFEAPVWAIALLGLIAAWAERQHVRVTSNTEMTVSFVPVLFAAVAYGPIASMVVAAIGLVGDFRRPYTRWLLWTGMRTLAGGLGGFAASAVLKDGRSFGALVLAAAIAALVDAVTDASIGSVTVSLRQTGTCRDFLASLRPILLVTVPFYAPLIAILVYAFERFSVWSVLLFVAPAFAAQGMHKLYREERVASNNLRLANERLERATLSFASALVAALDARDRYTAGHSAVVAVYARDIARRMGLSEQEQSLAYLAGLLHDIGKVGLPPGILEKEGPLTLDERRKMEEHAAIGERILREVEGFAEVARIVRHHHERIDGNGYPDALKDDAIPIISRIIAVSDAYNAMTSGRPYRDAMPTRVARLRLAQAVDSQFDTSVVAAFEAILTGASEAYRAGERDDLQVTERGTVRLEGRAGVSAA